MGRPTAILFAIVAVIVDALNRHSFGSFAHIGKKGGKIFPRRVVRNPTSGIAMVAVAVSVATLTHLNPHPISWVMRHPVLKHRMGYAVCVCFSHRVVSAIDCASESAVVKTAMLDTVSFKIAVEALNAPS